MDYRDRGSRCYSNLFGFEKLDTSGELEYWEVIFPDGGHAERWIVSEGFQKGQK